MASMRLGSVLLVLCFAAEALSGREADLGKLSLTPQRLKRLKRDRDRQTDRWTAFEHRVLSAQDSPERGLELAVYYAVSGDAGKGREAVDWVLAHPCETLPLSLVSEATEDLQTPGQATRIKALACPDKDHPLAKFGLDDASIPGDEFLLSLRPGQVERPSWQQHVAGLALVNLDPNSRAAQFLQGWAMEDRFTLHDGPGVVYEFLWADPYLPGVSYQNMPPWIYSEAKGVYARADWSADACWLHISDQGRQQEHCPADVFSKPVTFSSLLLLPAEGHCLALPVEGPGTTTLLSNLRPQTKVSYVNGKEKLKAETDVAGLWRVPVGTSGNVCTAR
jgi:hypothetical protein